MSFQLHVDVDVKHILNHFQLLEIMIIKSTCLGLDLCFIETACKFLKITVI